jgi:fatty-acyl-CoA synthase
MERMLKTTRPVLDVRTIEDVAAIESRPYDELVTARNLHDLFLATRQHGGDRKAITVLRSPDPGDLGISLTHRQLLAEVTRAANMFRALGLSPGAGVAAFLAPTLPEVPALLLGAQVAGVASSLNYLLSRDAIIDLLVAEQATTLVLPSRAFDPTCWEKAQGVLAEVPTLTRVLVMGGGGEGQAGFRELDEAIAPFRADALDFEPPTDRSTVCALFHTGGTTGRPKLVRLTHGNQIHAAFGFAQVFGYDERDVVINGFPFFHVGGTMTVGLSVLAAGGHIVVPSPYGLRPPSVVDAYWPLVESFGVTVVGGVPTSIAALTNSWKPGTDVSTVRMAVTGGAVLPKAVGARFEATTGIRIHETYGMTETAAAIAFNPGRGEPIASSVGFRAPFSQTRVVRLGSTGDPCAPNESGLVQVRGPQVFPGYVDPAHNKGTLAADGWLTTGDVGYLTEDARLVLTGREKDLIVRSGHNIDPAAIEDVANRFEGIQISAAVGMPDQYAGEVPALFVVPAPGVRIDLEALSAHLEANVHEPPARPRSVLLIDALPVTAVGKIFKPALRDLAIKEKVRLETAQACGPAARADADVRLDDRKRIVVNIVVDGASGEQIAALDAALKSLPQAYMVRAVHRQAEEPVRLAFADGIATLTLDRPESLNAASEALMRSLERQLQAVGGDPHGHWSRLLRGRRPHRIRDGFEGWWNQSHRHVTLQSGRDPDDRGPSGAGHCSCERGGGCRRAGTAAVLRHHRCRGGCQDRRRAYEVRGGSCRGRDGAADRADRSVARRATFLHGLSRRRRDTSSLGPRQRGRSGRRADGARERTRARDLQLQSRSQSAHQGIDLPHGPFRYARQEYPCGACAVRGTNSRWGLAQRPGRVPCQAAAGLLSRNSCSGGVVREECRWERESR